MHSIVNSSMRQAMRAVQRVGGLPRHPLWPAPGSHTTPTHTLRELGQLVQSICVDADTSIYHNLVFERRLKPQDERHRLSHTHFRPTRRGKAERQERTHPTNVSRMINHTAAMGNQTTLHDAPLRVCTHTLGRYVQRIPA